MSTISTRILLLSDTHGVLPATHIPSQYTDVAIHCGDMTDGSKLAEFRNVIDSLKKINSPLKLVIAGNHDFTMDLPAFDRKVKEAAQVLEPDLVAREYGRPGQVKQLFDDARDAGIFLLEEGNHHFRLNNGASLNVYASPYTPSMGTWGFQYHPNKGHEFSIEQGTDIVVTHGPPQGIMDRTHGRERAGCPDLFRAVARARPRIHCFGHIHEGWGAKLVSWRDDVEEPTHFSAINNDESVVIETLRGLRPSRFDAQADADEKSAKRARLQTTKAYVTGHRPEDEHPLEWGRQTMFVNAAIESFENQQMQKPWLVDIELPMA